MGANDEIMRKAIHEITDGEWRSLSDEEKAVKWDEVAKSFSQTMERTAGCDPIGYEAAKQSFLEATKAARGHRESAVQKRFSKDQ